ncbi:hypothetical protein [Rivularia sp. PCC 7116]|nr:hypothetical protein [Rivularia sp. PCC 7116]
MLKEELADAEIGSAELDVLQFGGLEDGYINAVEDIGASEEAGEEED